MIGRCAAGLVAMLVAVAAPVAQTRVQVGYCTSLKNVAAAKAAGFDYVEVGTSEIAAMSDADFEAALSEARRVGLPVPAANLFCRRRSRSSGRRSMRIRSWPTSGRRSIA